MMSNVEWRYAIDTFQSFIARLLLLMVVGSCAFLMYGTSVGGVEESSEQAATSKANQALKASSTSRASAPVNENTVEVDASTARVIYQRRGDEWEVRTQGGTVQIRTADLTAVALNLKYHSRTGVLEIGPRIKGSVTNARFEGKLLTYTIRDRHWTLEEGLVKFEPQFFKQGVVKPVYLRGGRSEGTMDEALVHHALFTSCDRPHPHWSLRASTVRILVNDKVIARHVGVFLGRRKLLTLPRLSVSIKARRRRTTMLPDIGRNDIEGWFFKYAYTYMATRHGTGVARFDWTEKRGMGFGIEQDYAWKAAMGALFIYWLRDRYRGTEFDWRIRHQQRLSRSMRLNLQWESRSNSAYFARSVKTTILSASFQRSVSGMQTMLDVRQSNYTGWGTTKDTYITLRHNYQKNRWSASLHSTYRRFQRSYGGLGTPIAPDEELQHRLEIRHTGDVITWMLAYEQRIDLDKDKYTGDRHFGLERLPELTMRFNIGRSILRWLRNLPLYASISLGKLVEYPERTARTRLSLGTALSYHRMQLSSRLSLLTSGRFEQCFYDDGTAQYIYDLRSQLEWSWGRRSRVQLGYQLQKPHGWTPFRFDRYTPYESTDLRVFIEPSERFRASVTTGLDIEHNIFRDVIFSMQWRPLRGLWWAVSSGYSLRRGEMRDILVHLWIAHPGRLLTPSTGIGIGYTGMTPSFYPYPSYPSYTSPYSISEEHEPPPWGMRLNLSTRYSTQMHKFARVRGFLDWRIGRWWRIQMLAGYNGFLKRFDFVQGRLVRDLHCYQLILTYDSLRREFRFEINLKAFPAFRQFFGASDRSQLLDTSVGQLF